MTDSSRIPGFYDSPAVKQECRPYALVNGADQVLVFTHGLTGSPLDFRNFVPPYVAAGYDVFVPLVPGHGSHITYLERLSYRELFIPFKPLMNYLLPRYRRIHLVGLSYGAILTTDLALSHHPASVSYFAPAFFLMEGSEKNMTMVKRIGVHHIKSRVSKKASSPDKSFVPHPHTYQHIPFLPATQLHERCQQLKPQISNLKVPVFHAHGDADETTSLQANKDFLSTQLEQYHFYKVPGGLHVLPLIANHQQLSAAHLAWLKEV